VVFILFITGFELFYKRWSILMNEACISKGAEEMGAISDSELVLSLQAGSLEALGVLYDRHRGLVFRTALIITGDAEAAADPLNLGCTV
jgi:hypothetical protein